MTLGVRAEWAMGDPEQRCAIPGCHQSTMRSAGLGLASFHCKRHVEHKARHGSHWHRSYSALDLKPYLNAAISYIRPRLETDPEIKEAIAQLALLLEQSPYEIATRLRGLSAKTRADIAFGRLRKKGIKPERLLAIHLAITALIEEDPGSHRVKEFRLVQVAKAVHRLASGYHRVWPQQDKNGRTFRIELHAYARSTGRVLRLIGQMIEERCEWATEKHLAGVLALKVKRYGRHPALQLEPKENRP
ncbi:hypothetical protein ACVIJ6_003501 [Bradyrhizobium sp. USDA 4369]